MAIGNQSTGIRNPFGTKPVQPAQAAVPADKIKTEFWINIGWETDEQDEQGRNIFVAMPGGIPLESIKPKPLKGKGVYLEMLEAGNAILEDVFTMAGKLNPGEAVIISSGKESGQLSIELRRIGAEAQASEPGTNRFMRRMVSGA